MTTNQNISAAAPELDTVEMVGGDTRMSFLLKSTLAVGAVYGTAMVGPAVNRAFAQSDSGDVDVLNFALTLEYLEADFYKQGLKLSLPSDVRKSARLFGKEESEHVAALKSTIDKLGGKAVAEPKFKFGLTDADSFLELANTLEDTGVSAYNGAAPSIKSKEVLGAAGSIVQIEARHAAVIRLLRDKPPAPIGFDKASTKAAVTKAITPLIQS